MGSRLEANSAAVRKRIEKHKFEDEQGEEYEPSKFGGFNDYFRRKKIKLQNLDAELRSSARGNPPIFRGVVAHVNGYTQPSLNDLHALIVSHGGGFMQYLDGKTTVTHIIASNLTPKKKVEFSRYRIVKPAWVVDSISAGKLLLWDAYRVVDEGVGQRVLGFDNGNIVSQANNNQSGYKGQTDTSWYTKQVEDVANRLNSRDPDWPFPSTQIPATNHAESSSEDELSKPGPTLFDVQGRTSGPNGGVSPCVEREEDQGRIEAAETEERLISKDFGLALGTDISPIDDERILESSAGTTDPLAIDIFETGAQDSLKQPLVSLPSDLEVDGADLSQNRELAEPKASNQALQNSLQALDPSVASPTTNAHDTVVAGGRTAEMTPEEHNAQILADPKIWKSTVVNPGFLKQYYEESRLHHLSAWKAALKTQLQALASEKSASQKAREKRMPGTRRYVLHVDYDSFFAAVSLKKCPQYSDKAVVIAHGNGSGAEIASCNYPARKFGIKNGMWMKHAQKLCPDLKVLPYDFKAYEEASRNFYEAIIDTGGIVQSVSVDEALVDVSAQCIAAGGHDGKGIHEGSIWREQAKADDIAQNLRNLVKDKTGCVVSVGIGGNILLAKVALRKAKPAGQYHIKPEEALDFLGELTMQDLPGIAYSIGGKLEEIGVKFVKDVRQLSKERMISVLGPKTGEKIWDYSRGIDRAEVGDQVIRKSVSAEVNWGIRFVTQEQADEFIQSLCDELHKRLLNEGVKGRQLTMKIMRRAADAPLDPPKHLGHGKCDTFNKSLVLGIATNDAAILGREALSILKGFGFSPGELRGLGIQMQKLEPIKGNVDSPSDGSQKRLQFKISTPRKPNNSHEDTIVDDIDSPKKLEGVPPPHSAVAFTRTGSPSGKPRVPLNTLGTQFVLPSQVDPEVLKELPDDIRSKLLSKGESENRKADREVASPPRSRSTTPALPADVLPTHSQIDQETLDALPTDVRSEILAYYTKSPHKTHNQALLPQSPRKVRSIILPKKLTTPTKKRGRPIGGGGYKASTSAFSTLTQSNFVANARASTSKTPTDTDEIAPDFLSALPEDIKREVLAQARRDHLQKRGGIDLTSKKKRPPAKTAPVGQRTLVLPPRPPKPTFTAQKFEKLPELREAITAWFEEFRDEGPYREDVDALVKYLKRVVGEERDMDKAVGVGKWFRWVVDEGGGLGVGVWEDAMKRVENGVQEAVTARGLGRVEF
ncbi:MAG: hypothetical protein Q9164_002669 [Protoblastenia rupestris]